MQMGSITGLIRDRLGRQASPQPAAEGDAAHALPVQHVVVGRPQGRRVADRHLLLAVAEFGIVVLHPQALCLQRAQTAPWCSRARDGSLSAETALPLTIPPRSTYSN